MGVDARIGGSLRGYRLDSLLGRGGMSVVYLAEDRRLGRKVALKLLAFELAEDERFRDRFLRESRLAASLDHPNVIPIYEAGEEDGQLFIAMRYVEGTDLRSLIGQGPLDFERGLAVVAQIAAALDAAHEAGLVHRDIKPGNVLLDRSGHVYLCDFGLTKQASSVSGLTGTGQLVGTLDYLAPEQIRGEPTDARADVYALGCVLCECLSGEPPFRRESEAATLWAHVQEPPPSVHAKRPELPAGLDAVVAKALAKEPSARYSTAGAFVDALRSAVAAEPRLLPTVRLPRRWRLLAVLAALALALALAGALAFTLAGGRGTIAVKPNSVAVIDAQTNRIVADVRVGVGPTAIAIGEGAVWVANAVDHTISRINPKTREVVRTIPVASSSLPLVAAGEGAVWVTSSTGTVARIDSSLNVVTRTVTIGRWNTLAPLNFSPASIAVAIGDRAIWIGDRVGIVSRVDPDTMKVSTRIDVRTGVSALAVGAGSVWAAQALQNTVRQVSTGAKAIIGSFIVGAAPAAVAVGEGAVWVAARDDDLVTRIDPIAHTTRTIAVGDAPAGIAVGGGSVWVANSRSGTVSQIDPSTNRVVATIRLGATPEALAFSAGTLWVTAIAGRPR